MARYVARLIRHVNVALACGGVGLVVTAPQFSLMDTHGRGAQTQAGTGRGTLEGVRILVVESGYYEDIADTLLAGAAARARCGAAPPTTWSTVPGALEIPQAIALALDVAARRRPMTAWWRSAA